MLLAGDIGGTKSILGIFSPEAGPRAPLAEASFQSARYPSLAAMASEFLASVPHRVDSACFGVAGPVVGGRVVTTNLPWAADEAGLASALSLGSVRLLNDLEALAQCVPSLGPSDLATLNPGRPQPQGVKAVLAPGTGLGESFLTWGGDGYRVHPSEGGHCDFAPRNALEADLLRHLAERHGHVSYESVCSGRGIPNLYRFLRDSGRATEPDWLRAALSGVEDPVPVILQAASDPARPCALCSQTVDLFLSTLGAEAGNLAIKVMATGGLFLGGGLPLRILPRLKAGPFLSAFRDKGRLTHVLDIVPVHVILDPRAALIGAAMRGLGPAPCGAGRA